MTENAREKAVREMADWLSSIQNMANIPEDESNTQRPDEQDRCAQLECLIEQVSESLTTLVKSMTVSVAALQNTAAPSQQNHLFVLETQITYLQRLAQDLTGLAPTDENKRGEA